MHLLADLCCRSKIQQFAIADTNRDYFIIGFPRWTFKLLVTQIFVEGLKFVKAFSRKTAPTEFSPQIGASTRSSILFQNHYPGQTLKSRGRAGNATTTDHFHLLKKKGHNNSLVGFWVTFVSLHSNLWMLGWVGGRWCLGSYVTGCCQWKSSGLRGYPLGRPQKTGRKPYFQVEHKVMNFQANWWCHFQRRTDDQWETAGHFPERHLSLGMQTDNKKLSFWKAYYQLLWKENRKVANHSCKRRWGTSFKAKSAWKHLSQRQTLSEVHGNQWESLWVT